MMDKDEIIKRFGSYTEIKFIDKLPDGVYYSRFPKDAPKTKNGEWNSAIGIVVVKNGEEL